MKATSPNAALGILLFATYLEQRPNLLQIANKLDLLKKKLSNL
jgi:hypothetical protein